MFMNIPIDQIISIVYLILLIQGGVALGIIISILLDVKKITPRLVQASKDVAESSDRIKGMVHEVSSVIEGVTNVKKLFKQVEKFVSSVFSSHISKAKTQSQESSSDELSSQLEKTKREKKKVPIT